MKKFKIIPVLAVSMLLTACQTGVKVSKPKFAAEGNSVELDKFVEELDKAFEASEFGQKELKFGSKELKGTLGVSEVLTKKRNDKQIYKSEEKMSRQTQMQADVDNKVVIQKGSTNGEEKVTSQTGKSSGSSSEKSLSTMQEAKVKVADKDVEGVVQTDDIKKQYELAVAFDEDVTSDTWVRSVVASYVSSMAMVISYYALPSALTPEEELKNYSFFQNDKVFTIKYAKEDKEPVETKATIKGEETVYLKTTTKIENEYQIDLTDGNMAFKYAEEETVTKEYVAEYSGASEHNGTVVVDEQKSYQDIALKDKKLSLKAVDLAKYEYFE